MEVNRREVPLYGQVEAHVRLRAEAPEDAQLYAVVQGTRLTHVTAATRGDDGLDLRFTVPGHDLVEAASVTPYFFLEGQVKPCEGEASLQYVRDVAQETAEYLSAHRDHLGPRSYLEVTRRFCSWERSADEDPPAAQTEPSEQDAQGSGEAGLRQLDEQITRALANMDYPPQWRDTDRQPREVPELQPGETLLHLAVRLGLLHLARFLIGRPRGQRALTSPNQEGDTPLQLAQRAGAAAMLRLLAAPAGPAADPVPAACCVWADSCRMLRFCSSTDCLVLTVRQGSGGSARDAVMLLRDRLGDRLVLTLISELRADCAADKGSEDEAFSTNEGPRKELHVEEQVLVDSVFEEQLVLSLDDEDDEDEDEDEERLSSLSVSGRGGAQFSQFSQRATEPPLPGVGGGSYGVGGVTRGSTGTDSGLWDSDELPAGDTPPPGPEDSPTLSAADRALARLNRLNSLASGRGSSPSMDCDLSPSLVALEVDSEEDSAEPKSPPSPLSSDADAREALRLSPDVTCARSHMASAAHEPGTKDFGDQGVRLRSYSYSSPKIALRPTRFASEVSPDAALNSVSHGRSLLQALSLSKSLSLLHPGKQRASSISEQSEKRIEEEELDNYNIPVKVESEKYKVIRTFSFLKYRMSSARNKTKGKGKDREAKDRQLNGHRFSSGPCLGPTVCVVCDKPASGKELLHCSSEWE